MEKKQTSAPAKSESFEVGGVSFNSKVWSGLTAEAFDKKAKDLGVFQNPADADSLKELKAKAVKVKQ